MCNRFAAASGVSLAILAGAYLFAVTPHHSFAPPSSPAGLLDHADVLAWENRWVEAAIYYRRAATGFREAGKSAEALYATVSEVPADGSASASRSILTLTEDLARPEAQGARTQLRILTILGMIETNYDARLALNTWHKVQDLALQAGEYKLATRAEGEQGIAAFILGDTATAKRLVVRAWTLSKVERDPAATVRYASVFGTGLVQIRRYKEALTPLNDAIKLASATPSIAYPSIAIAGKIDALAGLHQEQEALTLADAELARLEGMTFLGQKSQLLLSRASIEQAEGQLEVAASDYRSVIAISEKITNYRGIVNAGGQLASTLVRAHQLQAAESAIDEAISANTRIPDELYLVPRNLAIKADILDRMGEVRKSDSLYKASIALTNRMLQQAATTNVERQLLAEMSDVYSGYFASLCSQGRYNDALQVLDNVRGRVEANALEHHRELAVHEPTPAERELTRLNLSLINTDDPAERANLVHQIYDAELGITPSSFVRKTISHPVTLAALQRSMPPDGVLIEYVLAEPASFALTITSTSVTAHRLSGKSVIEDRVNLYTKELRQRKEDQPLARELFVELLAPVKEYGAKSHLIIAPDGALHLLPFAALDDGNGYLIGSHDIDISPSATVYDLLRRRAKATDDISSLPYVGVAAWTQAPDSRNAFLRAVSGPERSQLVALPDSRHEIETVAEDLQGPSTLLEGSEASETRFKELPLGKVKVIHLALHGYADLDYPDRSALLFAPDPTGANDGMLQVREIRELHLSSSLVTLSACDTGVGPVGDAGIVNLVNAFIEAGADTVVSTLWELEDHSTEVLMSSFYAALAQHTAKDEALRRAQLQMLKQGLPPYYWASFQIVGDGSASL